MNKLLLNGEIPVNSYIIQDGNDCFIIDPGFEKERVLDYMSKNNLNLKGVLLTHAHFDHTGAIDLDVPVYIHTDELEFLADEYLNGYIYYGKELPYDTNSLDIRVVNDGDIIKLNNKTIEVIHTPGHTPGGVCFKDGNEIYTGDTIFYGSIGRYDFPKADQRTLMNSVINFLESNDDETILYPAHGESTTIAYERKYNQYYLFWKKNNDIIPFQNETEKLYYLGKELIDEKNYEPAIPIFENLMKLTPDNMMVHAYLKMAKDKKTH